MSDHDPHDDIPAQGYWPSVTDLFLTLFIIAIAVVAVVFCALLPTNNVGRDQALVQAVGNDLLHIRGPMNRLRAELGMDPVAAGVRPSEVIQALSGTCDEAVSVIRNLKTRLEEAMNQVSRLAGNPDTQAEMARLLRENEDLKRRIQDLEKQLKDIGVDPGIIGALISENNDLRRQLHDKPPNIQISEQKKEYRFNSGSSIMGAAFVEGLTSHEFATLAREIVERQQEGRVKVDTLEIIGHTDGAPLSRESNLDERLPGVLAGKTASISTLSPGSNNDLGLMRALAVREQWVRFTETHAQREILRKIHIRCYSAGQTIPPDNTESPKVEDFRRPDDRARRIEMRLTRLGNDPVRTQDPANPSGVNLSDLLRKWYDFKPEPRN